MVVIFEHLAKEALLLSIHVESASFLTKYPIQNPPTETAFYCHSSDCLPSAQCLWKAVLSQSRSPCGRSVLLASFS